MAPEAAPGRPERAEQRSEASRLARPPQTVDAPDVSLVVPAHDEAQVLPALWARIYPVIEGLEKRGLDVEVVLVNDGSADDTLAVMRALNARSPHVRVVDLARRFGHQAALMAGLDEARGRAVMVMDADLQDPPELIADLVTKWEAGYDVAYGVRRQRRGDSLFKRSTARLFYRLLSVVAGEGVRPDVGDFYLMDRRVVDVLRASRSPRPFLRGLLSQAGFRHVGVLYDRSARYAGETKYPLKRMLALAADAMVDLTFRPLRIATALGFLLTLAGAGLLYPTGLDVRALLVLLAGVQLLSVGLLGEYVGRIHAVVAGRPLYLVREVIEARPDPPGDGS